MKRRWNLVLTAAICASLMMHGLIYDAIVVRETQELAASIHQPAFDLQAWLADHPSPVPQEEVELPPLPSPPPVKPLEELFGERGGKGNAANRVAGDQPMQARQSEEEQASLTPHPGRPSEGGNGGQASPSAQPKSQRLALVDAPDEPLVKTIEGIPSDAPIGAPWMPAPPPLPPKMFKEPQPPVEVTVVPSKETSTIHSKLTLNDSPATKPVEISPATQPVDLATAVPTTSPFVNSATTRPITVTIQTPRVANTPDGKPLASSQPTPNQPPSTQRSHSVVAVIASAHPAQNTAPPSVSGSPGHGPSGEAGNPSESESDDFSDHPTIIYRNGSVEARDGRKVKTVRPKLTEAGRLALASMDRPVIIIKAKIDEHGKVTDADYITKSGIAEVDLPHLRAAYEWEFEPTRDPTGRAVPDTQIISFVWQ